VPTEYRQPTVAGGVETPRIALRVLSYNAYHLPAVRASLVTSEQRLSYLPDALVRTGADIIILQEVWTPVAQNALAAGMQQRGYRAYKNEDRSVVPPFFLGNGLMVFAKNWLQPAGAVEFREWKEAFGFDDYASKGIIKVPLYAPGVGRVDVFNAHTSFLPWDGDAKNYDFSDAPALMNQVVQLANWAKTSNAAVKILGADMNFHPFVWDARRQSFDTQRTNDFHNALTQAFYDPFMMTQPSCVNTCDTWDNQSNSLVARGLFGEGEGGGMYDPEPNARYDYVMFAGYDVQVAQVGVAMRETYPVRYDLELFSSPLSDHYAVVTDLLVPKIY
jgi:hypothetical protein